MATNAEIKDRALLLWRRDHGFNRVPADGETMEVYRIRAKAQLEREERNRTAQGGDGG